MKSCISQAALLLRVTAAAGAISLASPPSVAFAQDGHGGKSASSAAASSSSGSVPGVVVQAPPKTSGIPTKKKAALDAAAAKRRAWTRYRAGAPAPTPAS